MPSTPGQHHPAPTPTPEPHTSVAAAFTPIVVWINEYEQPYESTVSGVTVHDGKVVILTGDTARYLEPAEIARAGFADPEADA